MKRMCDPRAIYERKQSLRISRSWKRKSLFSKSEQRPAETLRTWLMVKIVHGGWKMRMMMRGRWRWSRNRNRQTFLETGQGEWAIHAQDLSDFVVGGPRDCNTSPASSWRLRSRVSRGAAISCILFPLASPSTHLTPSTFVERQRRPTQPSKKESRYQKLKPGVGKTAFRARDTFANPFGS